MPRSKKVYPLKMSKKEEGTGKQILKQYLFFDRIEKTSGRIR
jgi:hypothetical protein